MAEPWAQSYGTLGIRSRAVLRGLAVLGLHTATSADLLAAGGINDDVLTSVLDELSAGGWITTTGVDRWSVASESRRWLAELANRVELSQAGDHVSHFITHLMRPGTLNATSAVRGEAIVTAVRAAARLRLADQATALAKATWLVVAADGDRTWWRSLADAGEQAAIDAREPAELVELLTASGAAFARAGDTHIADRQWRRAYALASQRGDLDRSAVLVGQVGVLRRSTGSFGRALTAFHQLIALRQQMRDRAGLAEALAELADTMVRAGRVADARHYLERAEEALPETDAVAPTARAQHAGILMKLGQGWDQQERFTSSMSCYSRALAVLIDLDDDAAAAARASLAAAARARTAQSSSATRGEG